MGWNRQLVREFNRKHNRGNNKSSRGLVIIEIPVASCIQKREYQSRLESPGYGETGQFRPICRTLFVTQ